jgi:hypothetical protein
MWIIISIIIAADQEKKRRRQIRNPGGWMTRLAGFKMNGCGRRPAKVSLSGVYPHEFADKRTASAIR